MASSFVPWWIAATWVSLVLLAFLMIGPASLESIGGFVLVTTIGVVPPAVLFMLWSDGPPPTVAEVLHAAEGGR